MRWPWRLHREWAQQAEDAEAQAEQSRRELQRTREEVVAPLRGFRERNHFAEIIRASLIDGREGK